MIMKTTVIKKPTIQIRTQKYAKIAYPLVAALKDNEIKAKYRTLVLNFPTMVLQSGLAQAIGFLVAKNKPEHNILLEHLAQLLGYQNQVKQLHEDVRESDITQYQLLTRKTIEASSWLKRYTQALLGKQGDQDDDSIDA